MKSFMRTLRVFFLFTILTGLLYPFFITGLCQVVFPLKSNGSLITLNGSVVGSSLIGQNFTSPKYFSGRPSAIEKPYDAANSGGSNLGPSSTSFINEVAKRIGKIRQENGLTPGASIPPDLVLASASGLDPDISLESALIQVPRVAKIRQLSEASVRDLLETLAQPPFLGAGGDKRVNVLQLNLALDAMSAEHR